MFNRLKKINENLEKLNSDREISFSEKGETYEAESDKELNDLMYY